MALVVYQGPTDSLIDADQVGVASETGTAAKFVGLSNQGATCYLNGLLQTLFMTPEFRKAIFTWNYDAAKDGAEEFCIPLQLQRLFGLLQLSSQRAVDTVALTHSFGWEGSEVFQQQDVQELTRVLFDALEETFKGTAVENIIDELYAGELIDYLRCLDVDYESERTDKFLDFSLAIVPFGSDKPMRSLTECIEMYLRPEILDGDNKYYAEKFDRKVDAIKGLKFGKLPKIMSVQLKRFVYDFSGPSIVQKKLNDVVKFPMILDMNKYVAKGASSKILKQGDGEEEHTMMMRESNEFEAFLVKQMDILKAGRETASSDEPSAAAPAPAAFSMPELISEPPDWLNDDVPPLACAECAPASATAAASAVGAAPKDAATNGEESVVYDSMTTEQLEELIALRGEWVYELYAVLIHSGVINGGHYYAYIKDLITKRWWNFNDSSVTPMDEKAVQEAWGSAYTTSTAFNYPMPLYGRPLSVSGRSLSSANAYMLMYRKVTEMSTSPDGKSTEPDSVSVPRPVLSVSPVVSDDMVPQYIRDLVQEELRQAEERRRALAEERNKLTVKVFWQGTEHTVRTLKNATYKQLLARLWEQLEVKHHLGENLTRHLQKLTALRAAAPAELEDISIEVASHEESSMQDDSTPAIAPAAAVVAPMLSTDALSGGPCFDLFRLRNYNAYTHLKSDAYDFQACAELSLDSLNFRDFRTYVLETRSSEDEWEVYYLDGLSLSILEYDPATGAFKEPRNLRMKRTATLGELRQAVSRWVSYSADRMHIMKITNCGFNDGQLDVLTNDAASLREDLGVYDGGKIYIEEKNAENEAQYKAFDAFLNARNRVDVRVNRPPDESFGHTLTVDLRWTVQQLRTFVAEKLELGTEELRLFKQSTMGVELRDGPNTLAFAGVYNSMGMAVKLGKATPVGYFNVQFVEFLATSNKVGVVELPELEPEYEIVETSVSGLPAVPLFGPEDPLKDSILDGIDDSPPPLVSVPYGNLNSAALAAVAGAGAGAGAHSSFDLESAIERNSVCSNEGVADYSDVPDLEDDFAPCTAADGPAVAAVEDITNFANFDDFPTAAVPVVVTAEAFPVDFSTDPVMPSSQVFPTTALPMESPYAVPADGERFAKSDVALDTVLGGDDVVPSDFGERMVKNCIEVTQFQPMEGFSNLFIQSSSKINEVKAQVVSKLVELGRLPEGTSPHRIRLREKLGNSPGQILSGDDSFSNNQVYLFDNKVLVFQVLDHEEFAPEAERGSVMVLVQRWNRSTWSLGDRFEVMLRGTMTIRNIARSLSFLTGIPLDSMLAMVLPREAEFPLSDIVLRSPPLNYGRSWFDPSKERRLLSAMSHELRVTDGDVLLLQDTSEPLMELSPADRKSIEIVRVANQAYWSPSASSAPLSGNRNPFDSHPASTNTSTKSGLKHGYGSSNGVHIKTHRDRLQEQSDRSLNSTAAACGTDAGDASSTAGSGTLSPVPPLEAAEADYVDNNVDYREFEKQGGVALFSDIN